MKTSLVLPLLLLGAGGHGAIALAQSPGTFSVTGSMTTPRAGHTATLLTDGKVLLAGGAEMTFGGVVLASAELYDPSTGAFTATGNMTMPRTWHSATLLPDGKVLIGGGINHVADQIPLHGAEIYDPSTGTFAVTGSMIGGHRCHQANLLGNGKVLIAGGSVLPGPSNRVPIPNAELYDPATRTFTATGTYATNTNLDGRNTCETAVSTLLPDSRVLIILESGDAELYDPYDGAFTPTRGNPISGESYYEGLPKATLLMNGKVLVAGTPTTRYSAELYDSWTGTFSATGNMITAHAGHTATLLPDGPVLLAGSFSVGGFANAELYDPAAGSFTATGSMITARGSSTATLLNNGQVLITGGHSPFTGLSSPANTSTAEIYHPVVVVPAPQLPSVSGDGRGAILHAGTARAVTASDPGVPGEVLEIYGTGLKDGSVIPPQVAIGGRLAEILYFGNAPGFTGLNQVNVRVPSGVKPGSSVSVRLTYIGRPSNAVTIAVQ